MEGSGEVLQQGELNADFLPFPARDLSRLGFSGDGSVPGILYIKKSPAEFDLSAGAFFVGITINLVTQGKAHQEIFVQIGGRTLGVIQQLAALGHHHQQTATGSMVMLVVGKVLGEVSNALGKHCNLETGGTGVFLVRLEVVDVNFAHCRISMFEWLIFRGCGKST